MKYIQIYVYIYILYIYSFKEFKLFFMNIKTNIYSVNENGSILKLILKKNVTFFYIYICQKNDG